MRTLLLFHAFNTGELVIILIILVVIIYFFYKAGVRSGLAQAKKAIPQIPEMLSIDKEKIQKKLEAITTKYKGTYGIDDADRRYNEIKVEINNTNDPTLIKMFTDAVASVYELPGSRL